MGFYPSTEAYSPFLATIHPTSLFPTNVDDEVVSPGESIDTFQPYDIFTGHSFDSGFAVGDLGKSRGTVVSGAVDDGLNAGALMSHTGEDSIDAKSVLDQTVADAYPRASLSRQRSDSEEKDANTPAQSRRKAQNRAAQRAFRERKEKHVKELEGKMNTLETTNHSLMSENERLRLALQRAVTENEILRATRASTFMRSTTSSLPPALVDLSAPRQKKSGSRRHSDSAGRGLEGNTTSRRTEEQRPGSERRNSTIAADWDIYATVPMRSAARHRTFSRSSPSALASARNIGQKAANLSASKPTSLSPPAAWDFIQSHPLFQAGKVDIVEVCERLKRRAKCDGQGPVFDVADVRLAVEESSAEGGDELT